MGDLPVSAFVTRLPGICLFHLGVTKPIFVVKIQFILSEYHNIVLISANGMQFTYVYRCNALIVHYG